ncbi:hypothetical protein LEP1GSC008_1037 [Leptospira kirschneri serovar Bulgarica str. Nikolaevo]|uniref:Uncharacterized protein n=1 Tax=Leptospira kirschneri serovar Bulgarica str. Nikolaevo TaxID=1240687 RepID=M6FBM8_9LEPT|nr:hypothetical protein LEP1GSC008_1037 [Leptospira kirschneri serovar Bulgarica str. Nikolaevo]
MFYNQFESRNAQIFFRIRNHLNRFCKNSSDLHFEFVF